MAKVVVYAGLCILDCVDGIQDACELESSLIAVCCEVGEVGSHECTLTGKVLLGGVLLFVVTMVPDTLLALDAGEPLGVVSVEVGIGKLPEFAFLRGVVLEGTLLEVRDLVEAIHVELADKGGEAVVLEEAGKHFISETDVVGHEEGGTIG